MRINAIAGIWVAAFLLIGGCSGSSESNSTTAESACTSLAKARCQRRDACTNNVYVAEHFGDEATCESREKSACVTALGAADNNNTPSRVQSCADAIQAESCSDLLGPTAPDACIPPAGARSDGSPCEFNAQCQSTLCKIDKGAACGVCVEQPKADDACEDNGDCGRGLICSVNKLCIVPIAQGQPCQRDRDCAVGLACAGAKTGAGTCQPAAAEPGATCDPTGQTNPKCDREFDLFCISQNKTCKGVELAATGAPCGQVSDSIVACSAGGSCEIPPTALAGTCVSPAADGAACDTAIGPHCLAPARCVTASLPTTSGTCKLPGESNC